MNTNNGGIHQNQLELIDIRRDRDILTWFLHSQLKFYGPKVPFLIDFPRSRNPLL
jgi:hypothetical protein